MNVCLLLKWWWRFGAEEKSLWNDVIYKKYYGSIDMWSPELVRGGKMSKIREDIVGIVLSKPEVLGFFQSNSTIVLGDGLRSRFLLDKWAGSVCLKDVLPRLFLLALNKTKYVSMVRTRVDQDDWNSLFRRSLFEWEMEELDRLKGMLLTVPELRVNVTDKLKWNVNSSRVFSVSSAYHWCGSSFGPTYRVTDCI